MTYTEWPDLGWPTVTALSVRAARIAFGIHSGSAITAKRTSTVIRRRWIALPLSAQRIGPAWFSMIGKRQRCRPTPVSRPLKREPTILTKGGKASRALNDRCQQRPMETEEAAQAHSRDHSSGKSSYQTGRILFGRLCQR